MSDIVRRPRRRDDLVTEDLDGELVILDPRDLALHVLDRPATMLWQVSDGTATVPEIAADVAEVFDLPAAQALADVSDFVARMDRCGLFTED